MELSELEPIKAEGRGRMKGITMYDEADYKELKEIAAREGTTLSAILQHLVKGFLIEYHTHRAVPIPV